MMQGDAYNLPIEIQLEGAEVNQSTFSEVEVCIGSLRKTLSQGQIKFDQDQGVFLFPLTQEETMRFLKKTLDVQVRVKMPNGEVIGTNLPDIEVQSAYSKVVL